MQCGRCRPRMRIPLCCDTPNPSFGCARQRPTKEGVPCEAQNKRAREPSWVVGVKGGRGSVPDLEVSYSTAHVQLRCTVLTSTSQFGWVVHAASQTQKPFTHSPFNEHRSGSSDLHPPSLSTGTGEHTTTTAHSNIWIPVARRKHAGVNCIFAASTAIRGEALEIFKN